MSKSKIWCLGLCALICSLSPVLPSSAMAPGTLTKPLLSQMVEHEGDVKAERNLEYQQSLAEAEAKAAQEAAEKAIHDHIVTKLASYTKLETDIIEFLVKQVSEKQLPLNMVAGLIDLESGWDIRNRNESSGATGLGQVMPGTARGTAESLGLEDEGHSYVYYQQKLKDPYFNIQITVAILDNLRNEYNGDWNKILTAYNRGEGGLSAWIRNKGTPVSVYSRVVNTRASNIESMIKSL